MIVGGIAFCILIWDFARTWLETSSRFGHLHYFARPIFAHKISELYIATCWVFISLMNQFEKMGEYPHWMQQKTYSTFLIYSSVGMIVATVIATYAWTQINFGTHVSSTNYEPLIFSENTLEVLVWRYYLAALVVSGGVYIVCMYKKGLHMLRQNRY